MRISTKSRFAVNAMIDLALREPAGPVALASISQRLDISLSYLEQIFGRLRKLGLVESTRGPGGGYRLGRNSKDISVAEIVQAVEDPLADQPEELRSMGMSQALWMRLQDSMLQQLAQVNLQTLVDEQVASGAAVLQPAVKRVVSPKPVLAPVRRPLAPNSVFAFGRSFA